MELERSLGGRVVRKKQQPDRRQTETSASCPAVKCKEEWKIDLLNGKIQTLNRKYLNAAFGSVLILILPLILNASAIWYAMPITEVLTLAYAETAMKKYADRLPIGSKIIKNAAAPIERRRFCYSNRTPA